MHRVKRALLFLLMACGGTSSDGSVEGRKFNGTITWGTLTQQATQIVVEETVNVCANKGLKDARRNTVVMELSLWNGTQLLPANSTGIYSVEASFCKQNGVIQSSCDLDGKPVPAGARYAVAYYTRDADVAPTKALAGNVRLTGISAQNGGSASGEYELVLETGDVLKGTFSGGLCNL